MAQYLNTSTVPQTRLYTLANILASCVNTSGALITGGGVDGDNNPKTTCSSLMVPATPPSGALNAGVEPKDTAAGGPEHRTQSRQQSVAIYTRWPRTAATRPSATI